MDHTVSLETSEVWQAAFFNTLSPAPIDNTPRCAMIPRTRCRQFNTCHCTPHPPLYPVDKSGRMCVFHTLRSGNLSRSVNEYHRLKLRSPFDHAQDRSHQGLVCALEFNACGALLRFRQGFQSLDSLARPLTNAGQMRYNMVKQGTPSPSPQSELARGPRRRSPS